MALNRVRQKVENSRLGPAMVCADISPLLDYNQDTSLDRHKSLMINVRPYYDESRATQRVPIWWIPVLENVI